jgi:VTC domain
VSAASRAGLGEPAWRHERKLVAEDLPLRAVEALVRLHPARFATAFPERRVNNLYLDTPMLDAFRANQDGLERRRKVRVRWYGALQGPIEPVLEFKEKRGLVGTKRTFALPPYELGPGFAARDLRRLLAAADLPDDARALLAPLQPALVNRYRRAYLLSADGRFRLTLDSELEFRPVGQLASALLHRRTLPGVVVLELKYAAAHDDDAARITSGLPLRIARSSKYAAGIELLLA